MRPHRVDELARALGADPRAAVRVQLRAEEVLQARLLLPRRIQTDGDPPPELRGALHPQQHRARDLVEAHHRRARISGEDYYWLPAHHRYSERLACPNDHPLSIEELEPRSFSFNSPYGACPTCTGLGTRLEADPELIVPDPTKTLANGAVAPWSGAHGRDYFGRVLSGLGDELGFNVNTNDKF